ncbi:MAG: hypothetical protein E6J50_07975 [Chloroflexi bacterium]|jgi:hypothetical protein|nr:MAG: hypothetical protein E6J50_07975 [Chloroflexota bacterium]
METEPAGTPERQEIVVDTIHDLHVDHRDPQHQVVEQNLWVALLPLALIAFVALGFVAAVWTILVAK